MSKLMARLALVGLLCLTLVLALAPMGASAAGTGPRPTSYTLPGDAVYPEGIAFQPSTGYFFVSSTTDGTIFRGHVKSPTASVFLPGNTDGRTFVAGVEVSGGRLFLAGGATGRMFVYNAATGALIDSEYNGRAPTATFINDVAVTKDGTAYFTESSAASPVLYRLQPNASGGYTFSEWLNLSAIYAPGFNFNGISATPDGKYLIVVQSNLGRLYRITIATGQVEQIELSQTNLLQGGNLTAGDGLELRGHTLYVVRNALERIAKVRLSGNYSSGTVVAERNVADETAFPTTAVQARGRLLVVNSQFNQRATNTPVLPFTVSSIRLP